MSSFFRVTFLSFFLIVSAVQFSLGFLSQKDSVGLKRIGNRLFIKHKVSSGEDVHDIARFYGLNPETIIALNPIAKKPLKVGQVVFIPHPQTSYSIASLRGYKVRAEETLYSIATKFDTDVRTLKELNELYSSQIRTGQELLIPYRSYHEELYSLPAMAFAPAKEKGEGNFEYHTVLPEQTLYSLSKKYKVSIDSLKAWNKIDGNQISAGQRLIVGKEGLSEEKGVLIVASASPIKSNQSQKRNKETGVCNVLTTTDSRLVALHRKAPIGTKVKVFNESSGRSVEVEVRGKLQDIDNHKNVVIALTPTAAAMLGTTSKAFPVYIVW